MPFHLFHFKDQLKSEILIKTLHHEYFSLILKFFYKPSHLIQEAPTVYTLIMNGVSSE